MRIEAKARMQSEMDQTVNRPVQCLSLQHINQYQQLLVIQSYSNVASQSLMWTLGLIHRASVAFTGQVPTLHQQQ